MRLAELTGKHKDATIYIVGTGPSMRVFPVDFLKDKITIGLNQAWRYLKLTYAITVHPELLADYNKAQPYNSTQWILKPKPPLQNITFNDPRYYVFGTATDIGCITRQQSDTLFLGRGVQQTAMHLAHLMGATTIVLVGVDMTDLGGDHHGHEQHVKFHGLEPSDVYAEYRKYTAKVRNVLLRKGVSVLTLTPFLGAVHGNEDYTRLRHELKLSRLPTPKDTSTYLRKGHRP